jgi:hypothetical protein
MPQNKDSQPPKVMTWAKATPILVIAFIFDAIRFMFDMFWFFGPIFAAVLCINGANTSLETSLGDTGGQVVAAICGGVAVAGGIVASPVLISFGVVMAMAVGFAGWIMLGLITMMTNARMFKENAGNLLWFVGGLMMSEVPIINGLPAFTVSMARMYHNQIKKEKAALKAYTATRAAELAQERQQQMAQLTQVQNRQAIQMQEAANEEQYDEIPEEAREAA